MERSTRIRPPDYEALMRILAEVAELPPDPLPRRQHALRALAELFGARCGLFAHTGVEGGQLRLFEQITFGYDDAEQPLLRQYFAAQTPMDPCGPHLVSLPAGTDVARLRRELIPDDAWYQSDHFNMVRNPMHLDDAVYSRVPSRRGTHFALCLLRPKGDTPFTERHQKMLALFNEHAKNLYRLEDPVEQSPLGRLAPRLRPVAMRFLAGR